MSTATSPTLTLQINAGGAVQLFQQMTAGARGLVTALRSLKSETDGASGSSALVKMKAEVKELQAALKANQLQAEMMSKQMAAQSQANVKAIAAEKVALTEKAKAERDEAKKTAAARVSAEKQAAAQVKAERMKGEADAEAQAKWLRNVRLRSAEMSGTLAIKGGDEFQKFGVVQAKADLDNELRTRRQGILQYRALTEEETRTRRWGAMQYSAAVQNEALTRKKGLAMSAAFAEDERRTRRLGLLQLQAIEENRKFDMARAPGGKDFIGPMLAGQATGHKAAEKATREHLNTTKKLTEQQQQLHAATRGVAGAMGGLWLTYSRFIVPMIAAFAAASAVRESFTQGLQFDYTTSFTAALNDKALAQGPSGLEAYKSKLKADIMDVAANTRYSGNELATGLRVMEQTGIDAAQGILLIKTAADAAVVGEVNLKTATEDLVGVMEVFKLRSQDPVELQKNFERVGDVLAFVAKETKANLHDVAGSMQGVIGVAGQFGVKLETVAAVVTQLGKSGIVGQKAGTFTRNMFENLYNDASARAGEIKKQLGITPFAADGSLKEDLPFLIDSFKKIKELNPKEQMFAISNIFNIRGAKPAREMLDIVDGIALSVEKIKNSDGTLRAVSQALDGVAQVELEKAKSRGIDLLSNAYTGANSAVVEFARSLQETFTNPVVLDGLSGMVGLVADMGRLLAKAAEGWVMFAGKIQGMKGTPQEQLAAAQQRLKEGVEGLRDPDLLPHEARRLSRNNQKQRDEIARLTKLIKVAPDRETLREQARKDNEVNNALVDARNERKTTAGRGDRFSQELTDPKAYAEGQALQQARIASSDAQFKREMSQIQQRTRFELDAVEARHRFGLISEEDYQRQVDELNTRRIDEGIEEARKGIERLQAARPKLGKGSAQEALDNRIRDEEHRRDTLVAEGEHSKNIVKLRIEGEKKVREEKLRTEVAGYNSDISKLVEQQDLKRRQAREAIENELLSGEQAARASARLATEAAFLNQAEKIQKEIEGIEAKSDPSAGDRERLKALRPLLVALNEQKNVQSALNEIEAAANFNRQREFSYGWSKAFNEYVENATNAAQQARDIFATATKGMEDAIVNFAKTGKFSFREFATSVVEQMIRIQAAKAAAGLMGMLGGMMPANTSWLADSFSAGGVSNAVIASGVMHTGGIVGGAAAMRMAQASMFYGAPRMHTGGLVGGEVPIIAQEGEGVFTPAQMKALAPAGSGGNQYSVSVTVNTQTGETQTKGNGADLQQLGVVISGKVREVIVKEQRPGGLLSRV